MSEESSLVEESESSESKKSSSEFISLPSLSRLGAPSGISLLSPQTRVKVT